MTVSDAVPPCLNVRSRREVRRNASRDLPRHVGRKMDLPRVTQAEHEAVQLALRVQQKTRHRAAGFGKSVRVDLMHVDGPFSMMKRPKSAVTQGAGGRLS